jgi:hypothetical protein
MLKHDLLKALLSSFDLIEENTERFMLESIRARYLLDDDLTIAITADATVGVFGAYVQPFNQRLVFRLIVRGVSNAFSMLMKHSTGRVANYDPDGAWPWVSTTTAIRIEADLLNKFIHGQMISFRGNSSLLHVMAC